MTFQSICTLILYLILLNKIEQELLSPIYKGGKPQKGEVEWLASNKLKVGVRARKWILCFLLELGGGLNSCDRDTPNYSA